MSSNPLGENIKEQRLVVSAINKVKGSAEIKHSDWKFKAFLTNQSPLFKQSIATQKGQTWNKNKFFSITGSVIRLKNHRDKFSYKRSSNNW